MLPYFSSPHFTSADLLARMPAQVEDVGSDAGIVAAQSRHMVTLFGIGRCPGLSGLNVAVADLAVNRQTLLAEPNPNRMWPSYSQHRKPSMAVESRARHSRVSSSGVLVLLPQNNRQVNTNPVTQGMEPSLTVIPHTITSHCLAPDLENNIPTFGPTTTRHKAF